MEKVETENKRCYELKIGQLRKKVKGLVNESGPEDGTSALRGFALGLVNEIERLREEIRSKIPIRYLADVDLERMGHKELRDAIIKREVERSKDKARGKPVSEEEGLKNFLAWFKGETNSRTIQLIIEDFIEARDRIS